MKKILACRLCNSRHIRPFHKGIKDYEYESPGEYEYLQCNECGLLNINPLPNERTLSLAYPPAYHAYHSQPNALARIMKKKYWEEKARRYSKLVSKTARILDAGCSRGDLLFELKEKGFKRVQGIDFSNDAVERAQSMGLNVIKAELTDLANSKYTFDLIIMINFIEHVYNPLEIMNCCNEMLKPGGIVVGETPNISSWDFNIFGKHWGGYHTPRHLHLFNKNTITLLGNLGGFSVKSITNIIQPAHWALSIQNRIQDSSFRMQLNRGRSFLFTPLILFFLPLNTIQKLLSNTSLIEFVFCKDVQNS